MNTRRAKRQPIGGHGTLGYWCSGVQKGQPKMREVYYHKIGPRRLALHVKCSACGGWFQLTVAS